MKTINKMRAELIHHEYGSGNCEIVVTDVIRKFMKNTPSYIETGDCSRKGCLFAKREIKFPLIILNNEVFANNMDNLTQAILANFSESLNCPKCRHPLSNFERIFNDGIFIEITI